MRTLPLGTAQVVQLDRLSEGWRSRLRDTEKPEKLVQVLDDRQQSERQG